MRKYFLLFFLIIICNGVYSQTDTTEFNIEIYYGSENNRIWFCSDSVPVAPDIKIEGDDFDGGAQGVRISISNYIKGEDLLVYNGSLNSSWNNDLGYLEFSSTATAKEYENAVKQVYYKNEREIPQLGNRYISITLKDANYLPRTKHFYEFIKKDNGIAWTKARSDASMMSYYGLKGYLATITSKAENDFIAAKVSGVGWFGASDADVEGEWKWVTGPETDADVVFWKGNETGVGTGYSKWGAGEPNNSGGNEDYAHLGHPHLEPKTWNDQGNGSGSITSIYSARGFIVEYGGMEGDPDLRLSASTIIGVEKIAFSNKRDFEICFGDSVTLNNIYTPSSNDSVYSWLPNEGIINPNIHNPLVAPELTTIYTATGKWGVCETSADFIVKVNPIPVHKWDSENLICKGESIKLDPGVYESYLWGNMDSAQTLTVSEEDWYTVTLTNNFECTKTDSTQVKWSGFPKLDYGELDTLVCGEKQQKLNLSFQNGDINSRLIPFQTGVSVVDETSLSPTITVDNYGVYHFKMEMEDQYQCLFFDTLDIEFHNQPVAEFFLDTVKCQGYNLDLEFTGTTIEPSIFTWFTSDSVFVSELDLFDVEIPLGYGERDRTVGLIVNEQGCKDSISLPVFVTPKMNFWVEENDKGCTPLNVQFGNSNVEDIESYIWNFGDGNSAFVEKPVHTYLNQNTIDLVFGVELLVVSAEGCTNTGVLDKAVVVHPIPTIDFSFEESICYSEKETVWYKGSGNENDKYIWDLSDFKPDEILQNPENSSGPLEFKRSSDPRVEIGLELVSEFGCKTDFFTKTFSRKPVFNVELDGNEGCSPIEVLFNASANDTNDLLDYAWNFGDGSFGDGEVVSKVFLAENSKYDIQVIANSNLTGCIDTIFLPEKVFVYPQPKAVFSADPSIVTISNSIINFENKSENSIDYEWDFGDSSLVNVEQNPEYRYSEMGFFDVELLAFNDFGCIDTFTKQVTVAFDKVFPPTAFSPNSLLEVDREFRIHSKGIANKGYQLQIFNRWGEIIFESESQEVGWDGKMKNGNFAPAGVYIWGIQYFDFTGKKHKQNGSVTLLF